MMSCQAARAAVSDYIDGVLDPVQARLLEEHLRACAACPPLYTALVAVCHRLQATRAATVAATIDADVGARMAARVRRGLTVRVDTSRADSASGGGGGADQRSPGDWQRQDNR